MNRLDFFKEWFYKETDRQFSLNESLNIPIGILTIVFGLLFFMFMNFSFSLEANLITEVLFLVLLCITILLGIIVVVYLFASYNSLFVKYEYKALPSPTELNAQYKKLEQYVTENKRLLPENVTADSLYEEQLIEMFSEYIDHNVEKNDNKMSYLYQAKQFLFICVVSAMLCAVPFSIHFYSNKENIQKVEIYNLSDFRTNSNY